VRTPTRFDRDLVLDVSIAPGMPIFARFLGSDAFETERSFAYEAGYRGLLLGRVSLDVAGFHNRYPNLVSYELGEPFAEAGRVVVPLAAANGTLGRVTGVEASASMRPSARWLFRTSYSYLNMQINPRLGADEDDGAVEDSSPRHQVLVSSDAELPGHLTLGLLFRWVARLPSRDVPAYSELDLHLAWRAAEHLELGLHGQNLLHPQHSEFTAGILGGSDVPAAELQLRRAVRLQATLRW
jgi:outer membrane receptor protein involved in Fe transport